MRPWYRNLGVFLTPKRPTCDLSRKAFELVAEFHDPLGRRFHVETLLDQYMALVLLLTISWAYMTG
jgi:hypothetical protein